MLQKLRSRHPIDLPAESWGRRRPTLAILGGIVVLFLLVPLVITLLSPAGVALGDFGDGVKLALAMGAGIGLLLLVLLVAGLRGKPGWNR